MTPRCWQCGRFSKDPVVRLGLSCERCWIADLLSCRWGLVFPRDS